MIAHYHGQIWNAAELAKSLGSSEPTARRYLDILSGTYVARQLPSWFENLKKRQVKAAKVYIRDSGICHSLLDIADRTALDHLYVVHPGKHEFPLTETITAIPLPKDLQRLWF
jgi:predicted AAA+ superfamily ATPase